MLLRRLRAWILCWLWLPLIAACSTPPPPVEWPEGTPVILVSIDTLRSDRLPMYGYDLLQLPALERLAADGIVFERAYSHAPTTLPAHASLLTGLLPPDHGVRDNAGYRLRDDIETLADRFRGADYSTAGFVSAFVLRDETGIGRGFDVYDDSVRFLPGRELSALQRPGVETVAAAETWLDRLGDEREIFLFVHLYEPHAPYQPAPEFASRYGDAYDGEIATADAAVGRLLGALDRHELYDEALIIVLSDHGEGLGDHGEAEHGVLLYREAIQVPLIVKLPGGQRAGQRVARPVQLIDVPPTLSPLAPSASPQRAQGASLLDDSIDPERPILSETLYPRLHFGWSELSSVVRGDYHYIHGPAPELFDVVEDPAERDDLATTRQAQVQRLNGALDDLGGFEAPMQEDLATRQRLQSLGYVASTAASVDGPRADPKSQLDVLEDLGRAQHAFRSSDAQAAITELRRFTERHPEVLDGWELLGNALSRAGRKQEAVDVYARAVDLSPAGRALALRAGNLLYEEGDLDGAEALAELGLDADGVAARGLLAQIAQARGDLDAAVRWASQAHETAPERPGPILTLASVLQSRGEFEQALGWIERIVNRPGATEPGGAPVGAWALAGEILANLGRAVPAEAAMLHEINLHPENVAAYSHLAVLYGILQRPREVGETLRLMVTRNPRPEAYAEAVKTLRNLGDREGARRVLAMGTQRFPDDAGLAAL